MNIAQIASKLRGQIEIFSGELSSCLPKVMRRFVSEAIYGIASKGSVRLSQIARSLDEPISMKKTMDRLSSRLSCVGLWGYLTEKILSFASSQIEEDTLLVVDLSDIAKKYAKKMQYLTKVRDGSEGKISEGYWTCDVVAVNSGESDILPVYHELYSTEAPDFFSENKQLLNCIERISDKFLGKGIFVMDRGADRKNLIGPLLEDKKRFIIRLVGNRNLVYRGKLLKASEIAEGCGLPYARRIIKEDNEGEKIKIVEYGFRKVRFPGRKEILYLVVVKGFGNNPLMLLTNVLIKKNRKILWWAVESYITRWRVEDTIRYIKQCYDLEDIRVMTYERLRNMAALVLATSYFTAVHIGLKAKLQIIACHALKAAKRIFGIPDFRYYALADGIKTILERTGRGLTFRRNNKNLQQEALLPLGP